MSAIWSKRLSDAINADVVAEPADSDNCFVVSEVKLRISGENIYFCFIMSEAEINAFEVLLKEARAGKIKHQ